MKAVLLEKSPISGTYPEQWYKAKGECTFALFEGAEYEKWLGVFGNGGITQYSAAIDFPTTACVLVIARGKGYVVDIQSRQLRYETECDYIVNAVEVPTRDVIVAYDFTRLYAFSSEKQLWQSDNIASDGIELGEVSNAYVRGKVWRYDQWFPFTLKVDELSIELGKVK
jgi:hypothetical protein